MKEEKIVFTDKDTAYFVGRNGEGKCIGLAVSNYNNAFNTIHLEPLTSKGAIARCVIAIPITEVDNLIAVLMKVTDRKPPRVAVEVDEGEVSIIADHPIEALINGKSVDVVLDYKDVCVKFDMKDVEVPAALVDVVDGYGRTEAKIQYKEWKDQGGKDDDLDGFEAFVLNE